MRRKANIAVITATNPQNSGMYSVDLAAKQFFTELGTNYTLFLTQASKKRISKILPGLDIYKLKFGGLKHKLLRSIDDLKDFSHVVYWGDFLNNPRYGQEDFAPRDIAFGFSNSQAEGYHRWSSLYALAGCEPPPRVIAVGGNFQHTFDEDET